MVQKLCDCECHKSYDFWRTCCGDAGIKEGDEATNQPVPQVCSKDLLEWRVGEIIESGWYWVNVPGFTIGIVHIHSGELSFQSQRIKKWAGPIPEPN